MADPSAGGVTPARDPIVRNAVIHLNNEQPVVADLFEFPTALDVAVVCTNMRTQDGKRPIFIDHTDSIFVIPLAYVRFIELPRAVEAGDGSATGRGRAAQAPPVEEEIEIDEDFLRKIRDA